MTCFFIKAGLDLAAGHPDLLTFAKMAKSDLILRWQSDEGREIFRCLESSGFSREGLTANVGKYYGHFDLRGISLKAKVFSGKDFSFIDFFGSDLSKCDFSRANLEQSWLSESNIEGAKFDWASMSGVLLDNSKYDQTTSFVGINLNSVNFTLAALIHDLAASQQRIAHLETRSPGLAFVLRLTTDYGRSLFRWACWCFGVISFFGLIYSSIPGILNQPSIPIGDGIYFSVVTFTTLGFGDIHPITAGEKFLVMTEVILGYLMGGLLVAIMTKKVMG